MVSIHAPVKGATSVGHTIDGQTGFNPRAREGRDRKRSLPVRRSKFQSTRP